MKEATPEDLAYILNQNKKNAEPGAIFLFGSGVSASSGIPSTTEIAYDITERYEGNPRISRLQDHEKIYTTLIGCLTPGDRYKLLQGYVSQAKINASHIYLAYLTALGYIDHTLTVNFDNLSLRALALFNQFPQVYDTTVLNEITSTSLYAGSVTFLHGQCHNPFLLDTEESREQLRHVVSPVFNKITNGRPWVVVGYGAGDPVFDCLVRLGRFDNGLYWVGDGNNEPPEHVRTQLLDNPKANGYWIRGCDADSFFTKLNMALGNAEPPVFDKPFSYMQSLQDNILDLQTEDMIKERLAISKKFVKDAISQYELTDSADPLERLKPKDIHDDRMRLELISCYLKKDYQRLEEIEQKINPRTNPWFPEMLSEIYNNRAVDKCNRAQMQKGTESDDNYLVAFDYFERAVKFNPKNDQAYHNWGTALYQYAQTMDEEESETYLQESYNKFAKAIEINLQKKTIYNNWGAAIHKKI